MSMSAHAVAAAIARHCSPQWRTRFAPAPTGWLHLGHAVNAVMVWGLARAAQGRVVLRIEDHDAGRCRPEYTAGILDDLDWLGLEADEAPTASYRSGMSLRQSARGPRYDADLQRLADAGLVYACQCSRREIALAAGRDAVTEELAYPGTCRQAHLDGASTPARPAPVRRACSAAALGRALKVCGSQSVKALANAVLPSGHGCPKIAQIVQRSS